MAALEALWDEEERAETQQWLIGLWVQGRSLFLNAEINDSLLPESKSEEKRGPNYSRNAEHNRQLKKLRKEWLTALSSPAHFAAALGMHSVFGEPPQEEEAKSASQIRREELEEGWSNFVEQFSASMDELSQKTGNAPIF